MDVTKATDSGQPITCHKTSPSLAIGHLNVSLRVSKSDGERHSETEQEGRKRADVCEYRGKKIAKLLFGATQAETKEQRVQQMGRTLTQHAEHRTAPSVFHKEGCLRPLSLLRLCLIGGGE